MKKIATLPIIAALLFIPASLSSAMTGGDFEIYADTFSVLDSEVSSGGDYELFDTAGEFFAATSTGGGFSLRGGYEALEKGILSFTASDASVNLGNLSTTTIESDTITISVSTDSETGYSVAVQEDGNLRDGANDIDDVADGAVTAGSEEYGIALTGADRAFADDQAITNGKLIASRSGTVTNRQTEVIFKAAIDPTTSVGTYSHDVTFVVTVNP